ncbi:hypothetical protein BC939DRAFT_456310 [Gamsiella multidivaricata]|uniref:uncharacterized protein n=1 Tax=Gamsiella multidivaricata TaxID=101098 RepID=UPI00221F36B8|nr:uncharacterized protein BC939DRAFT_456310 [Gamsiella multidivaricata]KAI7821027.1 hypothetical protein BC939DRAFT_456310 [Gamsiella multidivaricata]
MATQLSKRRKNELKDIAQQLGLSTEGVREDLVDRIKSHVAKHGSSDPSLHHLVREDSSRAGHRLASLSSANEDDDTSDGTSQSRSTRSSPRKKTALDSRDSTASRSGSDSDSTEDPLSEHQVRNFMSHVQDEVHEASDLAHSLEHILQEKYQTSKESLRRASKDLTSSVTHTIDGVKDAVNGVGSKQHKSKGAHRGSRRHNDDEDESHRRRSGHHRHRHHRGVDAWYRCVVEEVKHRFVDCAGACGFSTCMSRNWQRVHDLGSSSIGFVWITFILELAVFMSAAYSHHEHHDKESWSSCFGFFTNWPNFLLPFFAYYGALFVIPTLLSQLFNVDRARKVRHDVDEHHHHKPSMTGLLSRTTTSGLSYFVFKFAMTYLLSQYTLHHPVSSVSKLTETAKEAAETVASYTGFAHNHHSHHLWSDCEVVAEVFRFVPASLSLATSGVGTVLALAEAVVSKRK